MFADVQIDRFVKSMQPRQPRPASPARLRAMARQIVRMHAEEDPEPDVWDPEREDELHAVIKATGRMPRADRERLRAVLAEVQWAGRAR